MTPSRWIILVVIIAFAIFKIRESRQDSREIDADLGVTCGSITRHERSGPSGRSTYYEYYVDGIRYESISSSDKRFAGCLQTNSCIGLTFEVEYAKGNPSNSRMVWAKPGCKVAHL